MYPSDHEDSALLKSRQVFLEAGFEIQVEMQPGVTSSLSWKFKLLGTERYSYSIRDSIATTETVLIFIQSPVSILSPSVRELEKAHQKSGD